MSAEPIEPQLWCAVIQTAWDDYFAPQPNESWRQGFLDWQKNYREAKCFLTKINGEWAQSRNDVCNAAGIDPDALREAVLRSRRS